MKLLLDMNLSPRWVAWLRERGWQAEHWSAVGSANATDSAVMTFAASNGFILFTHDLDFSAILAVTHGRKPSVVQIRSENVSPEVVGHQIVTALRNLEASSKSARYLLLTHIVRVSGCYLCA